MRFSPAAVALSLTFAVMSSASIGARGDDEINARSVALMKTGDQEAGAGRVDNAIGWYESALAVDPRNRAAYIAMARAVKSQGLDGKAIGFYKEALELEPNDQIALAEQADAFIAKQQAQASAVDLKATLGAPPEPKAN